MLLSFQSTFSIWLFSSKGRFPFLCILDKTRPRVVCTPSKHMSSVCSSSAHPKTAVCTRLPISLWQSAFILCLNPLQNMFTVHTLSKARSLSGNLHNKALALFMYTHRKTYSMSVCTVCESSLLFACILSRAYLFCLHS